MLRLTQRIRDVTNGGHEAWLTIGVNDEGEVRIALGPQTALIEPEELSSLIAKLRRAQVDALLKRGTW